MTPAAQDIQRCDAALSPHSRCGNRVREGQRFCYAHGGINWTAQAREAQERGLQEAERLAALGDHRGAYQILRQYLRSEPTP